MEMFLMVMVLSLLGAAVSAVAFSAATRGVDDVPERRAEARPSALRADDKPAVRAPRFFADERTITRPELDTVSMVLQIERHIRLEQAAAEAFLALPTAQSLHSRTASPLSN
jgi:hypothetical protein